MHTKLQTLMESEDAVRYTPAMAAALNPHDIARILHSLHEPHHTGRRPTASLPSQHCALQPGYAPQ